MLGVVRNPTMTPTDEVVKQVADQMGVGHTFGLAPVGVFFGRDGRKESGVEADGPIFGGAGPRRRGCLAAGECMTGCRRNAKNTLVKNYLYLAEGQARRCIRKPRRSWCGHWATTGMPWTLCALAPGGPCGQRARSPPNRWCSRLGRGHAAATAQDAGRLRCDRRVSEPQPLGACSQQRITGQDHPPVYPHRCDALCSHCRSASVHALASLEPSSFLRCRSGTRAWCRSGSPGAIFDHWTLSVLTCRLAWRRADTITGTGSAPAGAHRRRAEVRLRSRGLGPEQLLVASSRSCRTPASRSARATR